MPAGALYAPVSFIQKNPNTVQALTNAMVRALLWLQKATPEQVVATVPPSYLLGNKDAYLASYIRLKDAYSPEGLFTEAGAQNTLKYLAAFNPAVKPAEIKLGQTFDNSYVQKALANLMVGRTTFVIAHRLTTIRRAEVWGSANASSTPVTARWLYSMAVATVNSGTNCPLQSGQDRPQPSAEPVLVTAAPMTSTRNMPHVVATASDSHEKFCGFGRRYFGFWFS